MMLGQVPGQERTTAPTIGQRLGRSQGFDNPCTTSLARGLMVELRSPHPRSGSGKTTPCLVLPSRRLKNAVTCSSTSSFSSALASVPFGPVHDKSARRIFTLCDPKTFILLVLLTKGFSSNLALSVSITKFTVATGSCIIPGNTEAICLWRDSRNSRTTSLLESKRKARRR